MYAAPVVSRIRLAVATSSAVPCAITRNLSALRAVSYSTMLSVGMAILDSPAPRARTPPNDPASQRHEHDEGTNARDKKEGPPEQQAPQPAPKGPPCAPELHTVAGVIIADDVLFRLRVL